MLQTLFERNARSFFIACLTSSATSISCTVSKRRPYFHAREQKEVTRERAKIWQEGATGILLAVENCRFQSRMSRDWG